MIIKLRSRGKKSGELGTHTKKYTVASDLAEITKQE